MMEGFEIRTHLDLLSIPRLGAKKNMNASKPSTPLFIISRKNKNGEEKKREDDL